MCHALSFAPMLALCVSLSISAMGRENDRHWNAKRGAWRHDLASPFSSGTNCIEVLLPDGYREDGSYQWGGDWVPAAVAALIEISRGDEGQ